jgi:hypothetical protein
VTAAESAVTTAESATTATAVSAATAAMLRESWKRSEGKCCREC